MMLRMELLLLEDTLLLALRHSLGVVERTTQQAMVPELCRRLQRRPRQKRRRPSAFDRRVRIFVL